MWNDHSPRGTWSAGSLSACPKAGTVKVFHIAPVSRANIGQVEKAAKGRIEALAAADSFLLSASEKGKALKVLIKALVIQFEWCQRERKSWDTAQSCENLPFQKALIFIRKESSKRRREDSALPHGSQTLFLSRATTH